MTKESLERRDALMRDIRAFFHAHEYVEVETPIRLSIPCMETHIDAEPSGDHFLRTSPEISHKKLIGAGCERIFEVGKCFRAGERGPLHHPEYTMLEWYRTNADYKDMLDETLSLLGRVWSEGARQLTTYTVSEVFQQHAGWDPVTHYDADQFDMDLVEKVEPALVDVGGLVALIDYPAAAAALSRTKPGQPEIAERWELYLNGVELANAYSELTDPVEQRARFAACAQSRSSMGKEVYEVDEEFLEALANMPPTGGVALGIDRLLMIMLGAESLDAVIPFR